MSVRSLLYPKCNARQNRGVNAAMNIMLKVIRMAGSERNCPLRTQSPLKVTWDEEQSQHVQEPRGSRAASSDTAFKYLPKGPRFRFIRIVFERAVIYLFRSVFF